MLLQNTYLVPIFIDGTNEELDFHDTLRPKFKEYFSPEVFQEWDSRERYANTGRRIYQLEKMISYPGRKSIEEIRERASTHRDAEAISSKIMEELVTQLPQVRVNFSINN